MKIFNNLTETIGNTPMLRLNNYIKCNNISLDIVAKLEYFNPAGSIKDRVALAMIEDAENQGILKKDSVIIEPTSGNTGIGLAFVGICKGYKVILTMPETMSEERKNLLKAFGAELILTDGSLGMNGAIEKAKELCKTLKNAFMPNQFENMSNPKIHKCTTAKEIIRDTNGEIDIFVAGVGTAGTLIGVGTALKEYNKNIQVIAVEPKSSCVLSGGNQGIHKIQGIGAGFIPAIYDNKIVDEIITVSDDKAFEVSRELSKTEGLLVGISSAAALCGVNSLAKRKENIGKRVITIFPDSGERYISSNLYD